MPFASRTTRSVLAVATCSVLGALVAASCSSDAEDDASVFYGDIQPLVDASCRSCHTAGGSAPFPFDDYEQVSLFAAASLVAIEAGTMPPWLPDASCRPFEGDRSLAPEAIARFRAWVEAGMPEGDRAHAVPYEPRDLTLEATHQARVPGYVSSAKSSDDYRCFILDDLTHAEETYVVGSQVLPGSPQVHHVLAYALAPSLRAEVEALDANEPGPGYTCFGGPIAFGGDDNSGLVNGFPTQLAAWVPGQEPAILDDGMAIRIPAESLIVLQVHYSALGGEPTEDDTELQLRLTDTPPEQMLTTKPLAILDLEIPPGEPEVEFTQRFTNHDDEPVVIRNLTGHMHLLGSSIEARVVEPSAEDQCAISIPAWDFNWQQAYDTGPDAPIVVAPGSSIDLTCRYDNSAANQPVVNGQQQDPVMVEWGDGTLDEMCLLYIGTVRPFAPGPPADASPCHGYEQCDCGESPTLECMLGCEAIGPGCSLCALQGSADCGLTPCGAQFLVAQDCLVDCFGNAIMFAGSVGACMEATCPSEFAELAACVDPILATGVCDEPIAACGVELQ